MPLRWQRCVPTAQEASFHRCSEQTQTNGQLFLVAKSTHCVCAAVSFSSHKSKISRGHQQLSFAIAWLTPHVISFPCMNATTTLTVSRFKVLLWRSQQMLNNWCRMSLLFINKVDKEASEDSISHESGIITTVCKLTAVPIKCFEHSCASKQ